MIIELSKNKSLLHVLTKVELDEETQSLLETDATKLELRKSLINNINTSNMITYRKLIKKADEEIETDEAIEEQKRKDEEESSKDLSDEELRDKEKDEVKEKDMEELEEGRASSLTERQVDAEMIARDAKEKRRKGASKIIRILKDNMSNIKNLDSLKDQEITSIPSDFRSISKSKLSRIIEVLKIMETKKRFLLTEPYSEFIENGDFIITNVIRDRGGTRTGRKGTVIVDEDERIDIQELNDTYSKLATKEFYEFLGKLYQKRFNENAPALRDRRKIKDNYTFMLEDLRTGDGTGSRARHKRIVKKYKTDIKNTKTSNVREDIDAFKSYIEDLKELTEIDVNYLLEQKEKSLRTSLSSLQNNFMRYLEGRKERKPISRKDLEEFKNKVLSPLTGKQTNQLTGKQLESQIKQIKESLSAVSLALEPDADLVEEIREELLDEINKEIDSLERVDEELRFMEKTLDPSDLITEYLNHPNKDTRKTIVDTQELLANMTNNYYRQTYLLYQNLQTLTDKSKKDFEGFIDGDIELSAVRTTFIDDAGIVEDDANGFLKRAMVVQNLKEEIQEKMNVLDGHKREMEQ